MTPRKIIHIDMDAFYASVELREQPQLRGKPVVVAWDGVRSVICAASYEARKYGLRSAMAVATAKRALPARHFYPATVRALSPSLPANSPDFQAETFAKPQWQPET